MRRSLGRVILALALGALCLLPGHAYERSLYIWQRQWSNVIRERIGQIASQVDRFEVLGGEFRYEDGRSRMTSVAIDWRSFEGLEPEITLVIRMNAATNELLETGTTDTVIAAIHEVWEAARSTARDSGVTVTGIQFDYDCPTAKLADYHRFLAAWASRHPHVPLSITALPTWLTSDAFSSLVQSTSYYVLQLHSFRSPRTADEARHIFPATRASSYLAQASVMGHPYYVALPTYGYEVAFTEEGTYLGLRAEGDVLAAQENLTYHRCMSDPGTILAFVRQVRETKPDSLVGVAWFRMPVATDEFNWHLETLRAVWEDRSPRVSCAARLHARGDGLYDLALVNDGQWNMVHPVGITVRWPPETLILYEALGQFLAQRLSGAGGITLTGPAPRVGDTVLVAWFRVLEPDIGDEAIALTEVKCEETTH